MANYSELLNDINAAIYENNDQEIDALEVRAILREMVTSLGSGFLFKGIATPSSPGTSQAPDQNVFYLATTAGTYTYLGGLVVAAGEVAFLCYDGTWTKKSSALLSTGSIVDNTTTEDATKPLSAKQGKVLADAGAATAAEVTALGQEVDGYDEAELKQIFINSSNNYRSNTGDSSYVIPVAQGDKISVVRNDGTPGTYGFYGLVTAYPVAGNAAAYMTGESRRTYDTAGTYFVSPADGYLVVTDTASAAPNTHLVKSIIINGDVIGHHDGIADVASAAKSAADEANLKIDGGFRAPLVENIFLSAVPRFIDNTLGGTAYVIPVSSGDTFSIGPATPGSPSPYTLYTLVTNYPQPGMTPAYMTGYGRETYEYGVTTRTIPEDGYLYVQNTYQTSNSSFIQIIRINGVLLAVSGLQKDVEGLKAEIGGQEQENEMRSLISHHGMFDLESNWWILDKYLDDTYASAESAAVEAFKSVFRARRATGIYQIAVISDTHGSGAYSWQNILRHPRDTCFRSIAVFNEIAGYCDAALHGGDLSCDYGTSRIRALQYMHEIVRKFCFNKPFFITKGNHDENNNAYVEADMLHLDWENNTYYVRNFSTFTAVTETTWNGSPLYVSKTELVSDAEFRNMAQHWLSPSGAVWGDGAYYYFDIDDAKLRFIVGNSFPVNDEHIVSEDEEYLWLAQTAFDLSAKATPSDWRVILLRHTQSTSLTSLSNLINAFRNGTSWTRGGTTINFGTLNGGGMTFIAHLHGHEHQNCFSNGAGYLDIGFNSAFATPGNAAQYGLSVLSIDLANKKFYMDTIAGNTLRYNYNTNKLEVAVGVSFLVAESGLARPVSVTSSDTSKATVNDKTVTAVSAGDVTIRVTGADSNYFDYPISVVSSY